MPRKLTKEKFIEKSRIIHGNKFDYSKVKYVNSLTKICIICPIHGEFWQLPKSHLNKIGCIFCGYESSKKKISNFGINDTLFETKNYCYKSWCSMINRCYDEKHRAKKPTYSDCTVCDEWKYFSNFKRWFDENYVEGYELDKDLLSDGYNKIYSPHTCCFVPQEINSIFKNRINRQSDLPKGVIFSDNRSKYKAQFMKNSKRIYLGYFDTPELAFAAYKKAKEYYIKQIANKWKDKIAPNVYEAMMNYQVEYNNKKKKEITEVELLTLATYQILYINDLAINAIKEIEGMVKVRNKEDRRIYSALSRRIANYNKEINDIVGRNMAFFSEFNLAMDETIEDKYKAYKDSIHSVYESRGIEDSEYLAYIEVARSMTEYAVLVNKKTVESLLKITQKAVSLRHYRLTELQTICENFADWCYRKVEGFDLNKEGNCLECFRELDKTLSSLENIDKCIKKANIYIKE